MSTARLDARGLPELVQAARSAAQELRDTREADERAAQLVGPVAAAAAPVRTGRTANALRWGATSDGPQVAVPVDWSVPLHWGAPANHQPAQPFVAAAFKRREADLVQLYDDTLDEVVGRFNQ